MSEVILSATPAIIFAFNRPQKFKELLSSLEQARTFFDRPVYIFVDAEIDPSLKCLTKPNIEVIALAEELHITHGHVQIDVAESNRGLRASVIRGVSFVLSRHESAIILEDDLTVHPDFFIFMDHYISTCRGNPRVGSISGYSPELGQMEVELDSVFLSQRHYCWGWATWADRWARVDFNLSNLSTHVGSRRFTDAGDDLTNILDLELKGRISSWSIRFDLNAFHYGWYCLCPSKSLVINKGFDGTGYHKGKGLTHPSNLLPHDARHRLISGGHRLQPEPAIGERIKRLHSYSLTDWIRYILSKAKRGFCRS